MHQTQHSTYIYYLKVFKKVIWGFYDAISYQIICIWYSCSKPIRPFFFTLRTLKRHIVITKSKYSYLTWSCNACGQRDSFLGNAAKAWSNARSSEIAAEWYLFSWATPSVLYKALYRLYLGSKSQASKGDVSILKMWSALQVTDFNT